MNLEKLVDTPAGQVVLLGVVAGAFLWIVGKQAKDAAAAVGTAVNPNSSDNLVFKGVNAVGGTITGETNFNLGHFIYDLTHDKPAP